MRKASIDAVVSAALLVLLFIVFLAIPRSTSWLPDVSQLFCATCQLMIAALIIAIPVGWVLSFLPVRGLLLVLRCIPFFWLAFLSSLPASLLGYFSEGRTGWYWIVFPAGALALFALPNVAAFDFRKSRADLIVSGLQCIVSRLPQLIAADFLVEIFFAWPGEGRGFIQYRLIGVGGNLDESIAIVLIASLVVIALRWLVSLLAFRVLGDARP